MAEKKAYKQIILVFLFIFLLILIFFAVKTANSSVINGNVVSLLTACTDKDGWNQYTASQCISGKSVYNDYCVSNSVVEYNCVKKKCSFKLIDCSKDQKCRNGACINVINSTN